MSVSMFKKHRKILLWLILAAVIIVAMSSGHFFFRIMIPTFAGSAAGAWVAWMLFKIDKEQMYIKNSKNVLLVLGMQMNRFEGIRKCFASYDLDFEKNRKLPPEFRIGKSEWRLSRNEIVGFHGKGDEENIHIMCDLMFLSKDYDDLFLSIRDYNKMIIQKNKTGELDFTRAEQDVQEAFFKAILSRLEKLDFQSNCDRLYDYLSKTFPNEIFPKLTVLK